MLCDRLKMLRNEKGLTQEMLATIIGVERSSIGKYESEKSNVTPSTDVLNRIADFFSVSTDFLLGRTDDRQAPTPISQRDPLIALYGKTKKFLDEGDMEDIQTIMRIKAERKKAKLDADNEGKGIERP